MPSLALGPTFTSGRARSPSRRSAERERGGPVAAVPPPSTHALARARTHIDVLPRESPFRRSAERERGDRLPRSRHLPPVPSLTLGPTAMSGRASLPPGVAPSVSEATGCRASATFHPCPRSRSDPQRCFGRASLPPGVAPSVSEATGCRGPAPSTRALAHARTHIYVRPRESPSRRSAERERGDRLPRFRHLPPMPSLALGPTFTSGRARSPSRRSAERERGDRLPRSRHARTDPAKLRARIHARA